MRTWTIVRLDKSHDRSGFDCGNGSLNEWLRSRAGQFDRRDLSRTYIAGFDGVELHAAHGYLFSQFLSPLANQWNDAWGGSLENRARLLLDFVRAVRAAVKPSFGVGVKLNSADFQRGGFDAADAQQVVRWLNEVAVDLVEVSGGTYESNAMQGRTADQRTLAREAYFLEFARDMAAVATMPVMKTVAFAAWKLPSRCWQQACRSSASRPAWHSSPIFRLAGETEKHRSCN